MMSPVGSADITRQWLGGGTELPGRPGVGGTELSGRPGGGGSADSQTASVANFGTKVPSSVTCVPEFGFPVCGRGIVEVTASSGAGAYSEEAAAFSSAMEARTSSMSASRTAWMSCSSPCSGSAPAWE